jgi:hypothetical protein
MKKLVKSFKGKSILCSLSLALAVGLLEYPWSSFLFLGEPEIPEVLREK